MKKTLSLLLVVLLCMTLFVSCVDNEKNPVEPNSNITENNNKENNVQKKPVEVETETETESPDLLELRDEISDNDAMFGIAYLGYNEGTFSDVKNYFDEMSLYELYPFVEDMELDRYCVTGGDDHYLIVPANKEVPIKAYIGVLNYETYSVDKGELVFESTDGSPFIVRGNESEIVPNIVIECGNVEYTPILSGEDGRLVENYGIYDFSPYEAVNEYFSADAAFCGSWYCEAENADYELCSMTLNLYVDNTAEYSYGYGNSEPIEHFRGDWVYDRERDMILLGMYGGEIDSDFVYVDPYVFECGFKWNMVYKDDGTYLTLVHEEGDPLIFGKYRATFEFVSILEDDYEDYSYLCATWAKISERVETYLELFEDGSANFSYTDVDGNEISCHGTWFADGLTLFLDLYDSEDNAKLIYSGEYGIMFDGGMLTLSHFDGDYLTDFMAENGYDSFVYYAVG